MKLRNIAAGVLCVVSIISCDAKRKMASSSLRTDKAPIGKRFRDLPPLISVTWKSEVVGNRRRLTVPSPSLFRIWGYAEYDKAALFSFAQQFEWVSNASGWNPEFSFDEVIVHNCDWKYSESFGNRVKPELWAGDLYVCLERGLIYFDLQGE